jgi:hypothetical protein
MPGVQLAVPRDKPPGINSFRHCWNAAPDNTIDPAGNGRFRRASPPLPCVPRKSLHHPICSLSPSRGCNRGLLS